MQIRQTINEQQAKTTGDNGSAMPVLGRLDLNLVSFEYVCVFIMTNQMKG